MNKARLAPMQEELSAIMDSPSSWIYQASHVHLGRGNWSVCQPRATALHCWLTKRGGNQIIRWVLFNIASSCKEDKCQLHLQGEDHKSWRSAHSHFQVLIPIFKYDAMVHQIQCFGTSATIHWSGSMQSSTVCDMTVSIAATQSNGDRVDPSSSSGWFIQFAVVCRIRFLDSWMFWNLCFVALLLPFNRTLLLTGYSTNL